MKFIIVGLHASGKREVIEKLRTYGCKIGSLFSNLDKPDQTIYDSLYYEHYDTSEIEKIFENKAYIFLQELQCQNHFESCKYFEGLSRENFDNNDFFVLSPDQLLNIQSTELIKEPICFVWMDCSKSNRMNRFKSEKRKYDFQNRDDIEKLHINEFVKYLYNFNNASVLYFSNEIPDRIASILHALNKYPDLIDDFCINFN